MTVLRRENGDEKRILLVTADAALRESLAEQLALDTACATLEAAGGAQALTAAEHGAVDLVVMDAHLPDMDGNTLCRRLRAAGVGAPLIMLAEAGPAPETEADELLQRPLRLSVLLARIAARLRQGETAAAAFVIGPYSFHVAGDFLTDERTGRRIRLTEKEAAILRHLCGAGGRRVGRAALLDGVWGYNPAVTTHTLETHIWRLRRKMECDPATPEILVTDSGGYRLALGRTDEDRR